MNVKRIENGFRKFSDLILCERFSLFFRFLKSLPLSCHLVGDESVSILFLSDGFFRIFIYYASENVENHGVRASLRRTFAINLGVRDKSGVLYSALKFSVKIDLSISTKMMT